MRLVFHSLSVILYFLFLYHPLGVHPCDARDQIYLVLRDLFMFVDRYGERSFMRTRVKSRFRRDAISQRSRTSLILASDEKRVSTS